MVRQQAFMIRDPDDGTSAQRTLPDELRKVLNERFKRQDFYASCLTCRHFEERKPDGSTTIPEFYCRKYKAYPPANVIVNSCSEGYDDTDNIPF